MSYALAFRRAGFLVLVGAAACDSGTGRGETVDSGFAAMQDRGRAAMGVDQYTSSHEFETLPHGGRIELQRDTVDSAGIAAIRHHLRDVARSFGAGNFEVPGFVHAAAVPGTAVMREKRAGIRYEFADLPRGGEIWITTSDPAAIQAIHEFLAFQRDEHHTGGH